MMRHSEFWMVLVAMCVAIGCAAPVVAEGEAEQAAAEGIKAYMPPRMINPREGIEGHTIYTLWHPDVPMDLPIQIQGGAFPFVYELTDGPEGMTLGSTYGQDNYGILKWNDPQPGTHRVALRVTDQDGTVVSRAYDLTVIADRNATDQFVFIDANAPEGGDGSIDRPFQDITDAQTEAHAHKTAIVREGRYTVTNPDFHRNAPRRWVGFPGEEVVFVNRRLMTSWTTGDAACINITWDEIHQDVVYGVDERHGNAGNIRIWEDGVSFVGYKLTFKNFPFHPDEAHNLNASCIMAPRTSNYKENIGLTDIHVDGLGYMVTVLYKTRYVLQERIVVRNVERGVGSPILFPKVDNEFVTTRNCVVWENIAEGRRAYDWYGSHGHGELAFNLLYGNVPNQRGHTAVGYPHWSYRNTLVGQFLDYGRDGSFVYANNVIVTQNRGTYEDSGVRFAGREREGREDPLFQPDVSRQIATVVGVDPEQVLDERGRLIGEYREKYLGKHGHEIVLPDTP